eukprot:m.39167 g.39167  ORF g.39167 m.39167 type:complete len:74 (-) comp12643_c0_seq1:1170-1391(-)
MHISTIDMAIYHVCIVTCIVCFLAGFAPSAKCNWVEVKTHMLQQAQPYPATQRQSLARPCLHLAVPHHATPPV